MEDEMAAGLLPVTNGKPQFDSSPPVILEDNVKNSEISGDVEKEVSVKIHSNIRPAIEFSDDIVSNALNMEQERKNARSRTKSMKEVLTRPGNFGRRLSRVALLPSSSNSLNWKTRFGRRSKSSSRDSCFTNQSLNIPNQQNQAKHKGITPSGQIGDTASCASSLATDSFQSFTVSGIVAVEDSKIHSDDPDNACEDGAKSSSKKSIACGNNQNSDSAGAETAIIVTRQWTPSRPPESHFSFERHRPVLKLDTETAALVPKSPENYEPEPDPHSIDWSSYADSISEPQEGVPQEDSPNAVELNARNASSGPNAARSDESFNSEFIRHKSSSNMGSSSRHRRQLRAKSRSRSKTPAIVGDGNNNEEILRFIRQLRHSDSDHSTVSVNEPKSPSGTPEQIDAIQFVSAKPLPFITTSPAVISKFAEDGTPLLSAELSTRIANIGSSPCAKVERPLPPNPSGLEEWEQKLNKKLHMAKEFKINMPNLDDLKFPPSPPRSRYKSSFVVSGPKIVETPILSPIRSARLSGKINSVFGKKASSGSTSEVGTAGNYSPRSHERFELGQYKSLKVCRDESLTRRCSSTYGPSDAETKGSSSFEVGAQQNQEVIDGLNQMLGEAIYDSCFGNHQARELEEGEEEQQHQPQLSFDSTISNGTSTKAKDGENISVVTRRPTIASRLQNKIRRGLETVSKAGSESKLADRLPGGQSLVKKFRSLRGRRPRMAVKATSNEWA
jgi:hypothetical protein